MKKYFYSLINNYNADKDSGKDTAKPISEYAKLSFSQEGEDMVLDRLLLNQEKGFYVDVGAHHPERFSNTNYYYLKGWRGINIDADPDSIKEFEKIRPDDINLSFAVGMAEKSLTFYIFNERAINTFDKKLAQERASIPGYKIIEKRKVPIVTLNTILSKYLPKGKTIDFLSIDVEGKDLGVLKSNDWKVFRPSFILVECLRTTKLTQIFNTKVVKFLETQKYIPVAKTLNTVIFKNAVKNGK